MYEFGLLLANVRHMYGFGLFQTSELEHTQLGIWQRLESSDSNDQGFVKQRHKLSIRRSIIY
jgi:hypothetical protein